MGARPPRLLRRPRIKQVRYRQLLALLEHFPMIHRSDREPKWASLAQGGTPGHTPVPILARISPLGCLDTKAADGGALGRRNRPITGLVAYCSICPCCGVRGLLCCGAPPRGSCKVPHDSDICWKQFMMCLEATWFVAAFHSTPMHDPGPEEFQRPVRVCVCT